MLNDLAGRLAEAKGPDRELDAAIASSLLPKEYIRAEKPFRPGLVGIRPKNNPSDNPDWYISECDAPKYTSSLDAAVALAEAMFHEDTDPWSVHQIIGAKHYVAECGEERGNAPTPALALCLAVIRALIAEKRNA